MIRKLPARARRRRTELPEYPVRGHRLDIGEPRCEVCGTVMHAVDAGYQCRGCGHMLDVPWVERERPNGADDLPGISGGRRDGDVR